VLTHKVSGGAIRQQLILHSLRQAFSSCSAVEHDGNNLALDVARDVGSRTTDHTAALRITDKGEGLVGTSLGLLLEAVDKVLRSDLHAGLRGWVLNRR
jgi:hypothetical protein